MVGYVGFLCPIVLPVPRLSRKIVLLGLALEGTGWGDVGQRVPTDPAAGGVNMLPPAPSF